MLAIAWSSASTTPASVGLCSRASEPGCLQLQACSLRRGYKRALTLAIMCSRRATLPRPKTAICVSGVARSARDRSALSWEPHQVRPLLQRSQDGLAGHPGRPARCSEKTARFVYRTALRSSSSACDVLEARWRPPTPAPRRRRSSARPRQIVAGAGNPPQAVSDGLQLLDVEGEGLGLPELEVHEVRRHHLRSLGDT